MLQFPNAKINIGLNVLQKRADGFHDIESIFCPIDLKDIIEIVPCKMDEKSSFQFTGIPIDNPLENNLCFKAYQLLLNDFNLPPIRLNLHKIIPLGAGLGGGSADAAFTITSLNTLFKLNLQNEKMQEYAASLGSDCAFFIENKTCIATGRGEIIKPVDIQLSGYQLVLVNPGISISTKEAYSNIAPKKPVESLEVFIKEPLERWKTTIKNDFEDSVFLKYPVIKSIKDELYAKGAIYASMTGSGSTVYGIFHTVPEIQKAFKMMNCFISKFI